MITRSFGAQNRKIRKKKIGEERKNKRTLLDLGWKKKSDEKENDQEGYITDEVNQVPHVDYLEITNEGEGMQHNI